LKGGAVEVLGQRNLPERVAEHLIDKIAAGDITLGSRILEVPLSEQLGISRSTLREGLRLLEARGVVEVTPQRRTTSRVYDPESIKTIYSMRETSELRAISLLLGRPERIPPLLASLEPILKEMALNEERSNRTLNKLDIAFHTTLVEATGEFALGSIWNAIKHHLVIIFSLEISDGANFAEDHRRLARAIADGKWPQIEREYRRHIAKDRLDVR
jgi:DNA-binding GntR family transcriptional regulator